METTERKHRRWAEAGSVNEQTWNALYDAWAKAEAEAERLGQQNNELCDRVFELEARVKELEALPPTAEQPSDEELAKLLYETRYKSVSEYADWNRENLRTRQHWVDTARAVREAVAAPLRAEIEELERDVYLKDAALKEQSSRLNAQIDRLEKESSATDVVDDLMAERDSLRAEIERLKEIEADAIRRCNEAEGKFNRLCVSFNGVGLKGADTGDIFNVADNIKAQQKEWDAERNSLKAHIERLQKDTIVTAKLLNQAKTDSETIDSLREKLAAAEAVHNELRTGLGIDEGTSLVDTVWDLRDKAEDAWMQPTTTRPVTPRFTVTAEDVAVIIERAQNDAPANQHGWPVRVFVASRILDYLAAHAVIDVPEAVPTAEEIRNAYQKHINDYIDGKSKGNKSPTLFAHEYLAPYLQPGAGVDPKICEDEFQANCLEAEDDELLIKRSLWGNSENALVTTVDCGIYTSVRLSPSDAHRAGLWLLSFAASQGIDVRLPVKPESGCSVLWSGHEYWGSKAAVECLAAQPQNAPIAPAETLEQLAEIAAQAYWQEGFDACYDDEVQQRFVRAVAAILRAGTPEVDVDVDTLQEKWEGLTSRSTLLEQDYEDMYEWLRYRIRYRVELPPEPDEADALTAAYMSGRYDGKQDAPPIKWPTVDEWTRVVGQAGGNHLSYLAVKEVATAIVARCDRLRDAAENGKGGE